MANEKHIGYLEVLTVLLCLHHSDHQILQQSGLGALAERFIAYQTVFNDRKVLVLVARTLRLSERKQLSEEAAREQVVILERHGLKWAKVWPAAVPPS